ncbi:MAG TPA: methyltransferase domain-containing protein [Vicinamibacterales bacterium]|nr:methyltransferase domain-containing protein [Vicinamibacterales bacterium]
MCPLCESTDYAIKFDLRTVTNPLAVPGLVVRCRHCAMWFKVVDDERRIAAAYRDDYAGVEGTDDYMTGDAARAFFRGVLLDVGTRGALLDIGAGQGALVEEATQLGFDAMGVDRCEPLARTARARGLRVETGTVEDVTGSNRFDVVTMMDVIEHVPGPRRLLAVAHRLLKPGGRLVVYTPNHRGAVVTLAKACHAIGATVGVREIFGGNHVCFFDDHSLPRALAAQSFEVERLQLSPYDPRRPGGPVSRVSLAAITLVETLGRPFGRVFRMLAFATKA